MESLSGCGKVPNPAQEGLVAAVVRGFETGTPLQHTLVIAEHGGRFEVAQESIGSVFADPVIKAIDFPYFYDYQRGNPVLWNPDAEPRRIERDILRPEESILSQIRDPERYRALSWLETTVRGYPSFPQLVVWSQCTAKT